MSPLPILLHCWRGRWGPSCWPDDGWELLAPLGTSSPPGLACVSGGAVSDPGAAAMQHSWSVRVGKPFFSLPKHHPWQP